MSLSPRTLLFRAIALALPSPRGREPRDARRVLVLRHDRIGDMLMTTGLLSALARARPDLEIDVAASAANAPVLAYHPAVRRVHVVREGLEGLRDARRVLRPERYDAVIDALALKKRVNSGTALLMLASGAPVRVGIGGREHDFVYTHPVRPTRADAHHVEYLAALGEPFGVRLDREEWIPDLPLASDERARAESFWRDVPGKGARLVVNVSTGKQWTRWPDDRTRATLAQLRAHWPDLRIAVTGSPGERASYEVIARAVGGVALDVPLRDALAVVASADVVFTPDTSIAHAAAAARRPIVVMVPRRTSAQFLPYRAAGRVVWAEGDALDSLDVAPVAAALVDVIGEASG